MRWRYGLTALFAALIAAGVSWYALAPSAVERLFDGAQNVAIVADPTSVDALRIGPLPEGVSWHDASISDYPVIAGPVALSSEIAGQTSAALLSSNTYLWDVAKACIPTYGVRLSFVRDSQRIDILLCFECDLLLVFRDGRQLGGEDFDNGRPALVRAAKAAFPDDQIIQQLKED